VSGFTGWRCQSSIQGTKEVPWPVKAWNPAITSAPCELSQRPGVHRLIHRNIKSSNTLADKARQVRLLNQGWPSEWSYTGSTGRLPDRTKMATSDPINSPVAGANR
jgi:hypothetical protein